MPLSCLEDSQPVYAFEMNDADWVDLKSNYRERKLTMSCCSAPAIPKVSHYGTRFFAHKAKATSAASCGGPESKEHLLAKSIIAGTATRLANWVSRTEVQGESPYGEQWQADVLCERGDARVAFEIQLSRQTLVEYRHRQRRYRESGVRACWLVRLSHCKTLWNSLGVDRNLPFFGLDVRDREALSVQLDSYGDASKAIALSTFVQGALQGNLSFYEPRPGRQEAILELVNTECYRCSKELKIVRGYRAKYSNSYDLVWLDQMTRRDEVAELVKRLRVEDPTISPVGRRYSRTVGSKYFAARCPNCNALQGKHFMVTGYYGEDFVDLPVELTLSNDELPAPRWLWQPPDQS